LVNVKGIFFSLALGKVFFYNLWWKIPES